MKYTNEIVINLPRDRVVELFDNSDNFKEWQPGLQSYKHISGDPGRPGARSQLIYDDGGRRIEMIKTITHRNLPDEFAAIYETKGVKNWISNKFLEEGADKTLMVTGNEFKFSGMMRIMSFFMRGSFPKQTQSFLENFKNFAESEASNQSE